jgi:hypothetical protein
LLFFGSAVAVCQSFVRIADLFPILAMRKTGRDAASNKENEDD